MSRKINRHLRARVSELEAELARRDEVIEELERRLADQEFEHDEQRAIEEARCERNKEALRAELRREQEARADLEYDAWRERRARGGR